MNLTGSRQVTVKARHITYFGFSSNVSQSMPDWHRPQTINLYRTNHYHAVWLQYFILLRPTSFYGSSRLEVSIARDYYHSKYHSVNVKIFPPPSITGFFSNKPINVVQWYSEELNSKAIEYRTHLQFLHGNEGLIFLSFSQYVCSFFHKSKNQVLRKLPIRIEWVRENIKLYLQWRKKYK